MKKINKDIQFRSSLMSLVQSTNLNSTEKQLFDASLKVIENGESYSKVVFDLKTSLSPLAVSGNLSKEALTFFTELSRKEPTSGASSIWNFLIKK